MTEQDARPNGGSPALDAAFGRPPGVESSFAPDAPPAPRPAAAARTRRLPRCAAASAGPSGRGRPVRPAAGRRAGSRPGARVAVVEAGRPARPVADARSSASSAARPDFGDGEPALPAEVAPRPPAGPAGGCASSRSPPRSSCCPPPCSPGLSGGVVGYLAASRVIPALLDPDATLSQVSPPVTRPPGSVADIARRVLPAVVSIEVRSPAGSGTGSGVVIDARRLRADQQPRHLRRGGHRRSNLRALFSDQSAADARVVGRDPKYRPRRAEGREAGPHRGRAGRLRRARGRRPGDRGRLAARAGRDGHLRHRQRAEPPGPARRPVAAPAATPTR